jgi:putative colanic acid biosysnthesis UDP-glucose lipid carrier transferase
MALRKRTLIYLFLALDLILLNLSLVLVSYFHYRQFYSFSESRELLLVLLNFNWILTYIYGLNDKFFDSEDIIKRTKDLFKRVWVYVSISAILLVVLNLDDISRTMFLGSSICFLVLKFAMSYLYAYLIAHRLDGPYNSKILVVGTGKVATAIQTFYSLSPDLGTIIGFLDDQKQKSQNMTILGGLKDFQALYDKYRFNEVIITLPLSMEADIKYLVNIAEYNGVRPGVVANYYTLFGRNFEISDRGGIPIVNVREVPLDSYMARLRKRAFDFCFSIFAIIMLFPLFIAIAVAIKLESKGPIFYRPTRIGKRGNPIRVFKFRSMRHSTVVSTKSTQVNDDRITKVGKFIRKYSIDELPQLLNVLKNEMSVVGPRPHRTDLNKRFQETAQNYMVRQYIKPGITGWAQVNGWRGPTETKFQYVARTLHDLWYIEHWSFALDLYIIYLTVFGKKTRTNAF